MRPTCFVLAGLNEVSKLTTAFDLIPSGLEQINPDDIARQFRVLTNLQEVVLLRTNEEWGSPVWPDRFGGEKVSEYVPLGYRQPLYYATTNIVPPGARYVADRPGPQSCVSGYAQAI